MDCNLEYMCILNYTRYIQKCPSFIFCTLCTRDSLGRSEMSKVIDSSGRARSDTMLSNDSLMILWIFRRCPRRNFTHQLHRIKYSINQTKRENRKKMTKTCLNAARLNYYLSNQLSLNLENKNYIIKIEM